MAPFFVFLEVLLKAGLLKDFEAAVTPVVQKRIEAWKAEKAAKAAAK